MSGVAKPSTEPAGPTERAQRPGRLPQAMVNLAARALPTPATRARYRQELTADLCGLGYRRQVREAVTMLVHCGALRGAVTPLSALEPPRAELGRKPLLCRVHHRLRSFVSPDDVAYRSCVRCGEDHYDGRGDNNLTGNVIGNVFLPTDH